jgi:hypothetical protein
MMSDLKRHFLSFARMKRQLFETAVSHASVVPWGYSMIPIASKAPKQWRISRSNDSTRDVIIGGRKLTHGELLLKNWQGALSLSIAF